MRFVMGAVILLLAVSSVQARVESSVTCGQVTVLDNARVKMLVNKKTFVINKSSFAKRLAIPGNACIPSSRLPASVGPAPLPPAPFLRPTIFRNANPLTPAELSKLRGHRLQFHTLRNS